MNPNLVKWKLLLLLWPFGRGTVVWEKCEKKNKLLFSHFSHTTVPRPNGHNKRSNILFTRFGFISFKQYIKSYLFAVYSFSSLKQLSLVLKLCCLVAKIHPSDSIFKCFPKGLLRFRFSLSQRNILPAVPHLRSEIKVRYTSCKTFCHILSQCFVSRNCCWPRLRSGNTWFVWYDYVL